MMNQRERALLVKQLLETFPDEELNLWEEEWAAELDRRHEEIEQGIAGPIPWSDLKKELSN